MCVGTGVGGFLCCYAGVCVWVLVFVGIVNIPVCRGIGVHEC